MKNDDSGEFEVVLGNRQLLSGFFIVVVLFGVFFTMGYIVGRNSAPSDHAAAPQAAAAGLQDVRPHSASGTAPSAGTAEDAATPEGEEGAAQTATQPVRDDDAMAPAAETAENAAAVAPPDAPAAAGVIEPSAGDVYLQVMAVRRPEAEVVVKTLRDKGFRAVLGQGPNQLVRVLVGPFQDTASLGQAKAGLENAGFHPIVRK